MGVLSKLLGVKEYRREETAKTLANLSAKGRQRLANEADHARYLEQRRLQEEEWWKQEQERRARIKAEDNEANRRWEEEQRKKREEEIRQKELINKLQSVYATFGYTFEPEYKGQLIQYGMQNYGYEGGHPARFIYYTKLYADPGDPSFTHSKEQYLSSKGGYDPQYQRGYNNVYKDRDVWTRLLPPGFPEIIPLTEADAKLSEIQKIAESTPTVTATGGRRRRGQNYRRTRRRKAMRRGNRRVVKSKRQRK